MISGKEFEKKKEELMFSGVDHQKIREYIYQKFKEVMLNCTGAELFILYNGFVKLPYYFKNFGFIMQKDRFIFGNLENNILDLKIKLSKIEDIIISDISNQIIILLVNGDEIIIDL